jgi:iron complex outermembrane recepter protein
VSALIREISSWFRCLESKFKVSGAAKAMLVNSVGTGENINSRVQKMRLCPSRQRFSLFYLLLFAAALDSCPAFAQGTINGKVMDPSGAAIANAQVTLTRSSENNVEQHATTDGAGLYKLAPVQPGIYTLTVQAGGFARYKQPAFSITATQNLILDITLQLESASQSVTVQGDEKSLEQIPTVGKTATKLEDLPISVQVISRDLVDAQGGIELKDTLRNSSGVGQGGSDSFGFGDRFLIRGLEARIYNDGFSDGDERNGIPHSLNGVERVEVLEGPGSSLFGSGPPGGTINVLHYTPSATLHYGGTFQTGSFGLVSGNGYLTGETGLQGLNYRVDGLAQHEDGFRSLTNADYELRPALSWTLGRHLFLFSLDARELQMTPDSAGLIYVNGSPIRGVTREAKYSTPFSLGDQSLARTIISDVWTARSSVTITNRFSYMYRNLSILRNGDSGTVTGSVFSGRQLRKQHDVLNDYDYETEPVWTFKTGTLRHTLLTGFEAQYQSVGSNRSTADLPNIANIFNPVVPERSTAGLIFLQDSSHSGFLDDLTATYLGLYATDQIDVAQRLKIRIGGRQDWWHTQLEPQVFVPGRILQGTQLIEPPNIYKRNDNPFSWSVGAVYRILPAVSPFFGVARSNLVNFNSEATQNGVQAPESGLQYEAGVKVAELDNRVMFTLAGFDVRRNNVFTLVGDVPVFNDQKTQGGEGNLQVLVGRRWKIIANGTGQHAALTDNPSNPAATGKRPVGVPQHIFNLWTTYDLKVAGVTGLTIGGGLTNRDKMFGDVLNTKSIPSYTSLDTVLSYGGHQWNVSFGFRNITNTRYFVAANGAGGFVGEPLSMFVQLRRTFGSPKE